MELLNLNDGWTQIPPKEDGEYWMASAKPWHCENAYDQSLLLLVRIKDGKRVAEMDEFDKDWRLPQCENPDNPVWDRESQDEMLAAWRPKRRGENFRNLPQKIVGDIFERHPATCSICGQQAATYRVQVSVRIASAVGKAWKTTYECPRICFSCGYEQMMPADYFDMKFMRAFNSVMDNIGGAGPVADS